MRRVLFFFLLLMGGFYLIVSAECRPKVLHISFHLGCIRDFEDVGRELDLDLTSWWLMDPDVPREHFDGISTTDSVYYMTAERADRVWKKHRKYFNTFDVIIVSDTAPLSRIFLQNAWSKPLIIWICNRFDFFPGSHPDELFPDAAYYELFNDACRKPNVQIVAYTPYEHYYARSKGIDTGSRLIKPLGSVEQHTKLLQKDSFFGTEVNKEETLFIYPWIRGKQLDYVRRQCADLGIVTCDGRFNGPEDIKDFKAVLYFPYQASNLVLFENFQRGVVHFVPSVLFMKQLIEQHGFVAYSIVYRSPDLVEWYCPEHRDLIVYFNSWQDLKYKLERTDYPAMRRKIRAFARHHRGVMLDRWHQVFSTMS